MERVQYIAAVRRARFNAICGPVNIPYGTTVEAVDGFLERDGLRLCAATSESAHKYFARDSDGHGLFSTRISDTDTVTSGPPAG